MRYTSLTPRRSAALPECLKRLESGLHFIERMAGEAARARAMLERLEQATLGAALRGGLR